MSSFKHLTREERNIIEQRLICRESFKSIARELGKDPTTIAKEIKNHIQFRQMAVTEKCSMTADIVFDCPVMHLCGNSRCRRYCRFCKSHICSSLCHDYQKEICSRLLKPPYVCNGCEAKPSCTLEKRIYSATHAQKEYEGVLSECRQGLQITEEEVIRLDSIISPLLMKGQSLHHICISHADESCSMNALSTTMSIRESLLQEISICQELYVWAGAKRSETASRWIKNAG